MPGTLKVHPATHVGAIAHGMHRFCQAAHGRYDGMAGFTAVRQRTSTAWTTTRVRGSYHRAAPRVN